MLFGKVERWVEIKLENVFKSLGAQYCTGLIWDQTPGFAAKNLWLYFKDG